jgi:hypothetical protein
MNEALAIALVCRDGNVYNWVFVCGAEYVQSLHNSVQGAISDAMFREW